MLSCTEKEVLLSTLVVDEALLAHLQIHSSASPSHENLKNLRKWLELPLPYGNKFLQGLESDTWKSENPKDYIILTSNPLEQDPLSSWLSSRLSGLFGRLVHKPTTQHEVHEFKNEVLTKITNIFSAVTASLIPMGSIFALYYITNMAVRLGLVLVFTTLFSAALVMLTSAKKIELFAAVSA